VGATSLGLLAPLGGASAQAAPGDGPGAKGAQVYCFMRNNGNDHTVSWNAAYALIKRQSASMFRTSPEHAAVMITEAEVDAEGQVVNVRVVRPPAAAKEVTPWVVSLIRRAAPFPPPVRMAGGTAVWREIWLVDKTGTFQVDALTEGQR